MKENNRKNSLANIDVEYLSTLNDPGELKQALLQLQDSYYNGTPLVSDAVFDMLWDRLRTLDPNNTLFSRVGADASTAFVKRRHIMFMHSQDKVQTAEDFLLWAEKRNYPQYLVEDKLDGMSLELQYSDGILHYAVSRGNGIIGDDLTHNVLSAESVLLAGVKRTLSLSFSGAIRGEVIMRKSLHNQYYPNNKNCRNTVNGIMKRKDSLGVEHAELVCYDVRHVEDGEETLLFPTEDAKLRWLMEQGFAVVCYHIFDTPEQVLSYHVSIQEKRKSLDYEIDGLIVKPLQCNFQDTQRSHPEGQVAFKFPSDLAQTRLIDVLWQSSGHVYTPVAVVEAVELAGTTVRRASLVNYKLIKQLGLKQGAQIYISKRGDIIPKIEALIRNPEGAEEIPSPPARCNVCSAGIIIEETRVFCPNPDCPSRQRHRVDKWLSVLSIPGLGQSIVNRLFETGKLRRIADLYTLKKDDLASMEGIGDVLAEKLLTAVHSRLSLRLEQFIAGFDIMGIGERTILQLVQAGFTTLEALRAADIADLVAVSGIAENRATQLIEELEALRLEMDELLEYVHIQENIAGQEGGAKGNAAQGKTFCFTGTLKTMPRNTAASLVTAAGGQVTTHVSSGLDYLVTNNVQSGNAKARKAIALGITVLSESEFIALVNNTFSSD